MIDFLANHPALPIFLYCLCAPPGLLFAGVLWWLSRRYDLRNPFEKREEERPRHDIPL